MKFIHLADVHLDSPFLGLSFLPSNQFNQIKQATENSFTKIIDYAIDQNVDLVLLAGDNFDSIHPSPHSQLFFKEQLQRLVDKQIQVVMILGNHDYINPEKLLLPQSQYFKLLGKNQEIEKASFTTRAGFNYDVVGFSYRQNHISEDMAVKFPAKDDNYTIGLMHAGSSINKNQDNYSSFKLSELQELNYDYFALGHIHLRQTLSQAPLVAYSGNIQGRHINESGQKGFLLGQVDSQKNTEINFIPTSDVIWQKVNLNLSSPLSRQELLTNIYQVLNDNNKQTTLFGLTIDGAQNLSQEDREFLQDSDSWLEISKQLEFNSSLVKVYFEDKVDIVLNNNDQKYFTQARQEVLDDDAILTLAKDLTRKSEQAQSIIDDSTFLKQVKELSSVKLGHDLKDIKDETN
ncbi:DNA repair exonuclease [uncultured Lactobacillus sp.]|uniref:metallophosphoesterase family protein n=1 Tax=uncultured Lactobacillus sp. TaxID=153152 RepID=UPI002618E976|nr:DNA repair exonuclease [uncultured Lactobacillus sp.]